MSTKYCLSWDDYATAFSSKISAFCESKDFSDVTLVSDDEKTFSAHQLILASSSRYFQNIFKKTSHPHPMIYLSGISSINIESIIKFVYEGKVEINQNHLNEFLSIAEKLKVEGLISKRDDLKQDKPASSDKETKIDNLEQYECLETLGKLEDSKQDVKVEYDEERETFNHEQNQENLSETPNIQPKAVKAVSEIEATEFVPLAKRWDKIYISDMAEADAKIEELSKKINGVWTCLWCGKTTTPYHRKSLAMHVESHIEGLSYPCDQCSKVFSTRNSIRTHLHNHKLSSENQKRWDAAANAKV